MENRILEQARIILAIADNLRNRKIDFTKVPFDNIVDSIQNIYEEIMKNGEEFVLLYGNQITKGLEHSDYDAVADVLKMIAYHFAIMENQRDLLRKTERVLFKTRCEKAYLENLRKLEAREKMEGKKEYSPFQGKGVVYSAIIGEYDHVKEPNIVYPELDYILFTDNPKLRSDVWQIRVVDNPKGLDNSRLSKRMKILGHEYLDGYDYSIWVDGKLRVTGDLREYINCYKRHEPMLSFNHHGNDCIYIEMNSCKRLKKDDEKVMERQIARYRKEGFPEHYGLTENAIIVRDIYNKKVIDVMEAWWKEVENGSCRDQLSLSYVCWKKKFMYDTCDLHIYNNKYVKSYGHK